MDLIHSRSESISNFKNIKICIDNADLFQFLLTVVTFFIVWSAIACWNKKNWIY